MDRKFSGSAAHFRAIAELQGGIAFIIDADSLALVYISPQVERLFGYSPADVAAHLDGSAVEVALHGMCSGMQERIARYANGDTSRERLVRHFDVRRKGGEVVAVEIMSMLVDGALVGIAKDISEQRARQAEQKRFASMLNHEFRTPLSTIDGAVQRLEATSAQNPHIDEATRERYRKIGGAVDRLIGMLDEYLSPDRVGGTPDTRHAAHCEPLELIREAASLARAAGRTVEIDAAGLPTTIRCEPGALRLALQVLVDNAMRYSPAGGRIHIHGHSTHSGVEIEVEDEGAGLAADELPRLTEKAFRGRNALGIAGSGMGLYMAKTVVEAHGGSLSAGNGANCGAIFRITLPTRRDLHTS
ncbi:MAG TPA: PAS domain-containing sensor histidine kinase [Telluria sp.]|nr:PAS domain-containing sensor histidine kinase [Telluria sp.]